MSKKSADLLNRTKRIQILSTKLVPCLSMTVQTYFMDVHRKLQPEEQAAISRSSSSTLGELLLAVYREENSGGPATVNFKILSNIKCLPNVLKPLYLLFADCQKMGELRASFGSDCRPRDVVHKER